MTLLLLSRCNHNNHSQGSLLHPWTFKALMLLSCKSCKHLLCSFSEYPLAAYKPLPWLPPKTYYSSTTKNYTRYEFKLIKSWYTANKIYSCSFGWMGEKGSKVFSLPSLFCPGCENSLDDLGEKKRIKIKWKNFFPFMLSF